MKRLIILGSVLCSFVSMLMADGPVEHSPIILAQKSFVAATASISPVTVFTPSSTGTFRVTGYVEQSNTTDGYGPEVFVLWTGDFGSYQQQVNGGLSYSGAAAAATLQLLTVHSAANQPIQISTTVNPNEQGTYNLYVVVERL
jgi:hypothetical protein